MRGHKLFQQSFLRLLWSSFAQWLKQSKNGEELEQLDVYENMISEKVHLCKEMLEMPVPTSRYAQVAKAHESLSIKVAERESHIKTANLQVKINGSYTPIPKQWDEYISNNKNKRNLALYLCKTCIKMGRVQLEDS